MKPWTPARQGAEDHLVEPIFAEQAWRDYVCWQQQDERVIRRINDLTDNTLREPFSDIGKPEPLKHALPGFWPRQIADEHRMIHTPETDSLLIAQLRYRY